MDKAKLLADRVSDKRGEVEIPGVGVVKFRALSRGEMAKVGEFADEPFVQERHILAAALTDPVLTVDEVAVWQDHSEAGEINMVAMAINKLSGIGPGAAKEQYKSVRDES